MTQNLARTDFFGVRTPRDLHEAAKILARRRLCSVSDVTRQAVAKELEAAGLWPPREKHNPAEASQAGGGVAEHSPR